MDVLRPHDWIQVIALAGAIALVVSRFRWRLQNRVLRLVLVAAFFTAALFAGAAYQSDQRLRLASAERLWSQLPKPGGPTGVARDPAALREAPNAPSARPSDPLAGYASSDTCVACHPGKHASWHASHHRSMTRPATPENVLGSFEGQRLEAKGRHYRLERRGDEYWVEMTDPDWEARLLARGVRPDRVPDDRAPRRWKRIVMTTGSHHMQTYWVGSDRDGRLFNFPWLWLNADQRWIPREDGFIRPPEGGRTFDVWHDSCVECHAVGGEKDFDPQRGWNPRAAELGIACEACHGPGEEHVRRNRNPLRRYWLRITDRPDPTIVNPRRLDAKASSQVCGYCHGINMWKPEVKARGVRYHPGDDLRETRVVLRASAQAAHSTDPLERRDWLRLQKDLEESRRQNPTVLAERFWPDGMVRVSGREHNGLIESACFQGGELSCQSCHSMHDSDPNDQLARDRVDDAACVQCHADLDAGLDAHTRHAPESTGSRCQNCHMPHTVYGLLKSIRSHWIDSPSAQTTVETGRPNACNLCHLDRPLGWAADHLASGWGQARPALSPDEETVAEGIRWALTGNAHQRGMIAWHFGWPDADAASGDDWKAYFLAHLLDDPYPAVRYVAARSLEQRGAGEIRPDAIESASGAAYDFLDEPQERARARQQGMEREQSAAEDASLPPRRRTARLLDAEGRLDTELFQRLARARDDQVMDLRE